MRDFLQLFSCICQVPLILEQIPENSDWEGGGVHSGPLDFSTGSWAGLFRGHPSECPPRLAGPGHAPRAHISGGQCQQAPASQRTLLKAVVGMSESGETRN